MLPPDTFRLRARQERLVSPAGLLIRSLSATAGDAPKPCQLQTSRTGLAPNRPKVVLSRPTLVTQSLLAPKSSPHALAMFVVTEAQAAAIRIIFRQRGEFSAAVELRRLFPGIASTEQAREYARTIASWEPLPRRLRSERPRPLKVS
jgi:hypothetical protein